MVWEDYRSAYTGNSDIYHTTVAASGQVSTDPEAALIADLTPQFRPRVFGSGGSGTLFYSRYDNFSHGVCAASLTEQGTQQVPNVATAKSYPAGTIVSLDAKAVTAAFDGFFYIQELDRSSGIKVASGIPVDVDDVVDVTGSVGISDGERQINASNVATLGYAPVPPRAIGIRGDALGGAGLIRYTPGITGAYGTHNIGLLATTWGAVVSTGYKHFYIQSGPATTIRVISGTLINPEVGDFVVVTGISSCEVLAGATGRAIRPRYQDDIQILEQDE